MSATDVAEPTFRRIRAIDVRPYHWGLWCTVEGSTVEGSKEPFSNWIVHRGWSEDGKFIWFGLDTHNAFRAQPDEELELVPEEPHDWARGKYDDEEQGEFLAKRPKPAPSELEELRARVARLEAELAAAKGER